MTLLRHIWIGGHHIEEYEVGVGTETLVFVDHLLFKGTYVGAISMCAQDAKQKVSHA